jgi:hypothetical protein
MFSNPFFSPNQIEEYQSKKEGVQEIGRGRCLKRVKRVLIF